MDDPNIRAAVAGIIILLLGAVGYYANKVIRLKADMVANRADVEVAKEKAELDGSEQRRLADAKWQELIQATFSRQADELRSQRTMIDALNTQAALDKMNGLKKDQEIAELTENQHDNVAKIRELASSLAERDELRKEVASLTKQVEEQAVLMKVLKEQNEALSARLDEQQAKSEAEVVKAELRHKQINDLMGDNVDLKEKLQAAREELERCIEEAKGKVA